MKQIHVKQDEVLVGKGGAKIPLDEQQLVAVAGCCEIKERIVAVNGPPGSGKTTILQSVYRLLCYAGYNVALCAPTGKAAKRISEVTGIEAMTIHRLLEYPSPGERDPETGKAMNPSLPKRCSRFPLEYDCVLCDEYAMVGYEVHRNLIDALPRGGFLRMFGDEDQLQPVEDVSALRDKPSPFKSVLQSKKFPSHKLEIIHRQASGSGILVNADLIRRGRMPKRNDDFGIHFTNQPVDFLRSLLDDYFPNVAFDSIENQIITPLKKTWIGTQKINAMLQARYSGTKERMKLPRHPWETEEVRISIGDKVIWMKNNYDLLIFNGETGIITDLDFEYETITIDFGDRVVEVPHEVETFNSKGDTVIYKPARDLDLAFAITTHKSQGSEYDHVIYLLNKTSSYIQCRPNLFTACTRAKKKVDLITDQISLTNSVMRKENMMDQKNKLKRGK